MVSYTGIMSELCSSLLYALTGILVKAVKSVDVLQMVCLQTTFELIVMLPITSVRHGQKIAPVHNKRLFLKLLLRGVWGAINMFFYFSTVEYLSLGDTATIVFASSIVAVIFGWIFFKERLTYCDVSLLIVTIIGCLLVAQPKQLISYISGDGSTAEYRTTLKGFGFGVITIFTNASLVALFRSFESDDVSSEIVTMYFVVVAPMVYWVMVSVRGIQFSTLADLGYIAILCAMCYLGKLTNTMAYQHETIFVIQVVSSSGIFFAFMIDYLWLGQTPSPYSLAGAVIITGAVLTAGYRKYQNTKVAG